jgi:hypothetical protein
MFKVAKVSEMILPGKVPVKLLLTAVKVFNASKSPNPEGRVPDIMLLEISMCCNFSETANAVIGKVPVSLLFPVSRCSKVGTKISEGMEPENRLFPKCK